MRGFHCIWNLGTRCFHSKNRTKHFTNTGTRWYHCIKQNFVRTSALLNDFLNTGTRRYHCRKRNFIRTSALLNDFPNTGTRWYHCIKRNYVRTSALLNDFPNTGRRWYHCIKRNFVRTSALLNDFHNTGTRCYHCRKCNFDRTSALPFHCICYTVSNHDVPLFRHTCEVGVPAYSRKIVRNRAHTGFHVLRMVEAPSYTRNTGRIA